MFAWILTDKGVLMLKCQCMLRIVPGAHRRGDIMKRFKNVVAVTLAFAMAFSLIGCGKAKDIDDEDEKEEVEEETSGNGMEDLIKDFPGTASERLGISEDDINEYDPSEMHNDHAFEGAYYVCGGSDMPAIECAVYDDPDEARETFEEYYSNFNEQFNEDNFDGDYECFFEDDQGYIIIDGSNSGTRIFGDRFATGDVYAGVFYEDNTVIVIMPRNDVDNSTVEDVISDLGLPMANGDNT